MTNEDTEQLFPVESEYARCAAALNRTGMLALLPKSERMGVVGLDGKEYPMPTRDQVAELFNHNRALVGRKVPQGFDRLELTPLAAPTPLLLDKMKTAILKHAAEGKICQTRLSPSDPLNTCSRQHRKNRLDMGNPKTSTRYRRARVFSRGIFKQSSGTNQTRSSQ